MFSDMRGLRRRTVLLAGLAAVTVAGCGPDTDATAPLIDIGVLEPVAADARALLASYNAVIETQPDLADSLGEIRDNHAAHLATLSKILGQDPDAAADPVDGDLDGDPVGTLRSAETAAVDSGTAACVDAIEQFTVLLGEIAACRASHVYLLGTLN